MKILSIVGARPQFVKLAAIARAMAAVPEIEHLIVHTGQHYDSNMSEVFFDGLNIPRPDINLEVGSGTHGVQTGRILAKMDGVLAENKPDIVLVYGDTNSTLAGTLSAIKMHVPVAHLEAGLRSFNRSMPEEHNRVLTDHASNLLLAPTEVAAAHLAREGLAARTRVVGDVMADVCFSARDAARDLPYNLSTRLTKESPFLVATIHRPENTDDPVRLQRIIHALQNLDVRVILLAHPRLMGKAKSIGLRLESGSVILGEPLAYHDLVATLMASAGIITDSGGLQKEAYLLNKVCTTVREQTEWVETLENNWNVLVPDPNDLSAVALREAPRVATSTPYGNGKAAQTVVRELVGYNSD